MSTPSTARAVVEQPRGHVHTDETRRPRHQHPHAHSLSFATAQRAQLGVLHDAVEAADRDVHQSRDAVEKPQPQNVETQEAHERRHDDPCASSRARRARASPSPAASCSGSAWRGTRRATPPTRAAGRRQAWPPGRRRRRARAPDRRSSARGGDRTGARSSRGSLRRAAASGRGNGCGAPSRTPAAAGVPANAARIARASSGVTRSSASRQSTQSCRACATAKFFCGPKPSQGWSMTRAPRRRGDFHGIIDAARVDDDDVVGERCRREAGLELSPPRRA